MSRTLERARALLERPGAWIDGGDGRYRVRVDADRRRRVPVTLDETQFRALIAAPGLRPRDGGGWTIRTVREAAPSPAPGRPGVIEGERLVVDGGGALTRRRANLGQSPIAWLARRKDASGRPYLTAAEAAAGERLRRDAERAMHGPSLTMRWDALPRASSGGAGTAEPGDRALAAARRVEAALLAAGPRLRPMLDAICVRGSSLQLAERSLGLRSRTGRTVLRAGLQALVEHYGGRHPWS